MRTNKDVLAKGVKYLLLAAISMFTGPTILYSAFSNQDKYLYIPILIVAIFICLGAVFLGFIGIRTIIKSMFNDTKN